MNVDFRSLCLAALLVGSTLSGAQESAPLDEQLKELTLHELSQLSPQSKIYLSSKTIKNLIPTDPPERAFLSGEEILKVAANGMPLSVELLGALRLANRGNEENAQTDLLDLIEEEIDFLETQRPEVKRITLSPDLEKVVGSDSLSDLKDWIETSRKETPLTEKEKERLKTLLGEVRFNARALTGAEFFQRYRDDFRDSNKQTGVEPDPEPVSSSGTPAGSAASESKPLDAFPKPATNQAPSEGEEGTLFRPSEKPQANIPHQVPGPGRGLRAAPKQRSVPRTFFSGGSAPSIRYRVVPELGGEADGKAEVVGAKPVDSLVKQELIEAIEKKRREGIYNFSVDMVTDYLSGNPSACQATAIQKQFDGFSCRVVLATAKHCVEDKGSLANEVSVGPLGTFSVSRAGGIDRARVALPNNDPNVSGSDIAAIHINKKGRCPSEQALPTFQVAGSAPKKGIILDGRDLLIGGVKNSKDNLVEVNLDDSFNSVGIYPGNSGGGAFTLNADGEPVFAGVLSSKFVDPLFADRLGLIEGQARIQDWFLSQTERAASPARRVSGSRLHQ